MYEPERRHSNDRILGEHGARLEVLSEDIGEIKADVKKLLEKDAQREGGKKTIYTLATIMGSLGGMLASKYFK